MSTSPTFVVNNPNPGQEYIAPSAYWVIPDSGSSISVTCQTFDGNGNLTSVSSLTAIRRNISSGGDQGSYTYNGGNSATSTGSSGTNGSAIFAPAGKVGSGCAQLRMYIAYTGRVYDQPPNAPSNLAPSGTVTTLTPTFTGSFSDPTGGDTLAQYEIVVHNAANGGGSQIWDSGNVTASGSESANSAFSRGYGGSALAFGSNYSFQARVANQNGNWGPWSGWVNFSTVQGPNAPSSVAPSGLQATATPAFSFIYSSPAGTAMASYSYNVTTPGGQVVYTSYGNADTVASGATVSGTIPAGANLQHGQSYLFNVSYTDANGATSPNTQTQFSVAALPQVAPSSPTGGVTVTTQTPTFAWTYSDPNYQQAQAQVEIQNATTGVDITLTGWMSQSTAQWTTTTAIPYGTRIRWRVQVQDSAGLGSGWSAWATAYVNNAPSATLTAPTQNATIATVTPIVTWTYTASSGGQAQASAQIVLSDANHNQLGQWTQSGASTSFALPAGLLINGMTYNLLVIVTDTNASSGQSPAVTFSVSLTPPADMAGQALPGATNWLAAALLNTDSGNGSPVGWTQNTSGGSVTAAYSIDPTITQPVQLASGDGPVPGAAAVALAGVTAAGQYAHLTQSLLLSVPGWTAGTTRLSAVAYALVDVATGAPTANVTLEFWNGSTFLSSVKSSAPLGDTGGVLTRLLGPQNALIPASTTLVKVTLELISSASGDAATVWWCDAQLEAATASDAHVIEGSLGIGYSYNASGFSIRTQLAGGVPTLVANPGADTDPVNAFGGSITLTWDTTLADARFTAYLIERRRQDASSDDSAWVMLATLTSASQSAYTDYTAAAQTTYQYAIRQQIAYVGGGVGVSQHRAIVVGSVVSGAWYLTNAGQAGAPVYNMRLRYVQPKRQLQWKERASYSAFLGRVGAARDAGEPAGYLHTLVCYFTELRGDSRVAIRRQLVAMARLGGVWYLKDRDGLALPVFIGDITFDDEATYSESVLTATIALQQAQDTSDD